MTKAEFLEKLRIELSSGVTPQVFAGESELLRPVY